MGRNSRKAGVPFRVAHWGFGASSAPSRPKAATPPAGRTHRQRCISAPLQARDLERVPGFTYLCGGFSGSRQAGEGQQKRLDLFAGHGGYGGKDAFQNGPTLDKAVCPGLALRVGFLVE